MKVGVSSYSFGRYRRATGASLMDVCRKAKEIGFDAIVTSDPGQISLADKIILPGVGAFSDAREKLRVSGLDKLVIKEAKRGKKT